MSKYEESGAERRQEREREREKRLALLLIRLKLFPRLTDVVVIFIESVQMNGTET